MVRTRAVQKKPPNAKPKSGKAHAGANFAGDLLAWYDKNRRDLPWRAKAGAKSDPYKVWLSEIMLQQTTVAAVGKYYRSFLARWPNVKALADASLDDVLGEWSGLGYYSRARNLHRAAGIVVSEHDGKFPPTADALRALPGVGGYTSNAIAAIAFGERAAAMDANAERVMARIFAVDDPLPGAKAKLGELAAPLVPQARPGDFAQALMDLGSGICTPRAPDCAHCPVAKHCRGFALGIQERLPRKAAKPERPLKRGAAFVAFDAKGAVYLTKRPEKGLLGAMLQPPLGEWRSVFPDKDRALGEAPFHGAWRKKQGVVRHGFTHFQLELEVWTAQFAARPNGEGRWYAPQELPAVALPTVMRKLIAHARDEDLPLLSRK
jgi:A/G-specific adenine glycosylase